MNTPAISIVLPIYKTRNILIELLDRLRTVLTSAQMTFELILINDASPDGSKEFIEQLAQEDPALLKYHFEENVGQHRAVLKGIEMSRGEIVVCMDADLQDLPESIPELLHYLKPPYHAVFAGRRGIYESRMRLLTSKVFKAILYCICHVPRDAGMFVAISRQMATSLLEIFMPKPFVVAMIGLTGLPTCSIPISRQKRKKGRGAYTSWKRLKVGITAIQQVIAAKKLLKHREDQTAYYSATDHFSIYPENYPRHIKRCANKALQYLYGQEGINILEIGCGMGRFTIPIKKKGFSIEGLDISSELIKKLDQLNLSIPTHVANLYEIPENLNAKYDVILGFFVLHHFPELEIAFSKIKTLLKPGGQMIFIEPNPKNLLYYFQIALHPKMSWKQERGMLNMRRRLLDAAIGPNFKVNQEMFGFFPPFLFERFYSLEKGLEKIPIWKPLLPYQTFFIKSIRN